MKHCILRLLVVGLTTACASTRSLIGSSVAVVTSRAVAAKKRESNILSLRGGAGPLNPEVTAKIATALVGLDCAVAVVAPNQNQKKFGLPSSPCLDFRCRYIHYTSAGHSLAVACLLFAKTSVNVALAVGLIFSTLPHLQAILFGKAKELGFSAKGQYLASVLNVGVAETLILEVPLAFGLMKALSVVAAFNGAALIFAPVLMDKLWGFPTGDSGLAAFFNRFLGYTVLAFSILGICLTSHVDVLKSIGYSCIPSLCALISQNFITREVDKYGLVKAPQLVLMAIIGTVVLTLAF